MTNIPGLPVKGYTPQSPETIKLVNSIKVHEEKILRCMDELKSDPEIDQRWLAIARTEMQKSYMCLVRSIFKPERLEVIE
jgi:hypothetical protein